MWNSDLIRAFNHKFSLKHGLENSKIVFGGKESEDEVYVGGINSASCESVQKMGITHIIHCITVQKGEYDSINEKNMPKELTLPDFDDQQRANVIERLPACFKFLDEAFLGERSEKSKVLIHCLAGSSRSSSICCAYIMCRKKTSFFETIEAMKVDRRLISPNSGFQEQLHMIEIFGFEIDENLVNKSKIMCDPKFEFSDEKFKIYEEIQKIQDRHREGKK